MVIMMNGTDFGGLTSDTIFRSITLIWNQIASLLNLDRGSSGTAKYVSITRRFYDIDRSIGW
jgi:hypothetical protein